MAIQNTARENSWRDEDSGEVILTPGTLTQQQTAALGKPQGRSQKKRQRACRHAGESHYLPALFDQANFTVIALCTRVDRNRHAFGSIFKFDGLGRIMGGI